MLGFCAEKRFKHSSLKPIPPLADDSKRQNVMSQFLDSLLVWKCGVHPSRAQDMIQTWDAGIAVTQRDQRNQQQGGVVRGATPP